MKIHDMIDSVFVMPDVNTSEMSAHGGDELVEHHSSSETEEETFPPAETSESDQSIPPKRVDGGAIRTVSSSMTSSWSHLSRPNV